MIVLMTADGVGGIGAFAVELARGLCRRGVRVVLAVMGQELPRELRAQLPETRDIIVVERPYRLEWMDHCWPDVADAGNWLLELAERFRPDLVHVNGYAHAALPFECPVVVGAHSCVLSWYEAVRRHGAPAEWQPYERTVRRGLAHAAAIVAPSHAMAHAVQTIYAPAAPVMTIWNARDRSAYWPEAKEPFVLSAGRVWDEAKNIGTLAAVAPALPWPVLVAGDGSDELPAVVGLGRLSTRSLAGLMRHAALFALPARYEPFGLSALEAALSGCALVLGDIPSLREVWDDAAVFVEPNDQEALRRALVALIEDEPERRRMGEKARTRASTFDAGRMADEYLALYTRFVGGRAARQDEARCES